MNKQSMWFLTLFSLILVLSIYYITMPNELLLTNNSKNDVSLVSRDIDSDSTSIEISEAENVVYYNEELSSSREKQINELQGVMLDVSKTSEEKNNAYQEIQYINEISGKEETLEKLIKETYKIDSFVEIQSTTVKVVCASKNHDNVLANKIIKSVQSEFDKPMYITVKFET